MADLLTCVGASPQTCRQADATDEESIKKASEFLHLSPEKIVHLKEEAISYALAHGLTFKSGPLFTHIPLSLLPVPFPLQKFNHGILLSPLYGKLVDRVSRDINWLHETLARLFRLLPLTSTR